VYPAWVRINPPPPTLSFLCIFRFFFELCVKCLTAFLQKNVENCTLNCLTFCFSLLHLLAPTYGLWTPLGGGTSAHRSPGSSPFGQFPDPPMRNSSIVKSHCRVTIEMLGPGGPITALPIFLSCRPFEHAGDIYQDGGVAQWLGRRSLAGGFSRISLIYG